MNRRPPDNYRQIHSIKTHNLNISAVHLKAGTDSIIQNRIDFSNFRVIGNHCRWLFIFLNLKIRVMICGIFQDDLFDLIFNLVPIHIAILGHGDIIIKKVNFRDIRNSKQSRGHGIMPALPEHSYTSPCPGF